MSLCFCINIDTKFRFCLKEVKEYIMSRYYYFYKEKDDITAFNDGGYAGIPSMHNYNLEEFNLECDNCDTKNNESEFACWG
jgi:hypothetical protein